jgi:DNA-binding CsgD family transcriptional regulator
LPLIGRDVELAIVRQFITSGTGGVLAVLGEAGIGKSRLLSEAAAVAARAGLTVHAGRAVEGNGSYRAVAQALANVSGFSETLRPYRAALGLVLPAWRLPNDSISVDPAVLLGEGLIRLLDGALLVLDDLQWADPETAALVTYLAESARGRRLLVAIAMRTDEPALLSPTPAMTALTLDRLAPDGAFAELVRAADGLPLVMEEMVRDRSSAPSLGAIVRARTDRLTAVQRTIIGAAALLGDAPEWTLLPTVTGHPEPVVLEALDAAHGPLLVADPARPDGLAWRHGLIREHVLATLTGPQRSALAARAAIALGDEPAAADLFILAGQRSRATTLLLRLARNEPSAPGALALLDRAELTPAVTAERVRLLTVLGRAPEALDLGRGLLARLRGDAHAAACLDLAEAAVATRRWADAERYLERAGRPELPRSLVIAADAAFGPGDLARAHRLASEVPDTTDDVPSLIHSYVVRARCDVRTDPDAGRALYARAAQLAAEHGLAPQRVTALLGLATIDLDETAPLAVLAEARDLALDTGQLAQVVWIDHLLTDRAIVLDGPAAAEPVARRAVDLAEQLRLTGLLAVGEAYLAVCRQLTGDTAGARTLLDRAIARPAAPLEVVAAGSVVDAARHLLAHDLRAATAALDGGLRPLLGRDETAPLFAFGLWALLSTVAGEASTVDLVRSSPAASRAANRAGLLYADAVLASDPAGLAAADRVLPESSWWRRLLRLIALEAAVDGGWGDPVPVLRVDLEAFTASGDEQFARTARDLLRRAGSPTRRGRGAATVPDRLRAAGVTSREMDVLRLVAAGLSNREIAERLFLSPRTVETHVARLLAKTGTATRSGLGALSQ